MSVVKLILQSTLKQLLDLLDEDQHMHFRKIHKLIDEQNEDELLKAIQLVERTLKNSGIELSFLQPTIKNSVDVGGIL